MESFIPYESCVASSSEVAGQAFVATSLSINRLAAAQLLTGNFICFLDFTGNFLTLLLTLFLDFTVDFISWLLCGPSSVHITGSSDRLCEDSGHRDRYLCAAQSLITPQEKLADFLTIQADRGRHYYAAQTPFISHAILADSATILDDGDRYYSAPQALFASQATLTDLMAIQADCGYDYAAQAPFTSKAVSTDLETIDADRDRYLYAAHLCSHRKQF